MERVYIGKLVSVFFPFLSPLPGYRDPRQVAVEESRPAWFARAADRMGFDEAYELGHGGPVLYLNESIFFLFACLTFYVLLRLVLRILFLANRQLFPTIAKRFTGLSLQDRCFTVSQLTFLLQFLALPVVFAVDWIRDPLLATGSRETGDLDPFGRFSDPWSRICLYYLTAVYLYDTLILVFVGRFGGKSPAKYVFLMLHHIMCVFGFFTAPSMRTGRTYLRGQIVMQFTHCTFHFLCVYIKVGPHPRYAGRPKEEDTVRRVVMWMYERVHLLGLPVPMLSFQLYCIASVFLSGDDLMSWHPAGCSFGWKCAAVATSLHLILYLEWISETAVVRDLKKRLAKGPQKDAHRQQQNHHHGHRKQS